ncbi:hypothetical protein HAV2_gp13 [Hyperthermophilic Archaeal Virus 2]|uniref:hypothetical protein n=1 Tax=Hyperthermophilic Archaeal Virus 2 TaxID=762906 RepID=UPI0001DBAE20|nr:hypothetical protein HAV2_gp13 [Hyperthermophilic Archaeal Virus 2]ADJ54276.1 hypothetical protein HAV2_gp13 [Hyperthermophilic Archaeal Virus 2]
MLACLAYSSGVSGGVASEAFIIIILPSSRVTRSLPLITPVLAFKEYTSLPLYLSIHGFFVLVLNMCMSLEQLIFLTVTKGMVFVNGFTGGQLHERFIRNKVFDHIPPRAVQSRLDIPESFKKPLVALPKVYLNEHRHLHPLFPSPLTSAPSGLTLSIRSRILRNSLDINTSTASAIILNAWAEMGFRPCS